MGLSLESVADCFCRGFSYTKSVTHPYEFHTYRGLRLLRDAPRTSGDRRKDEFIVVGMSPKAACDAIRELKPGRFFLCPIDPIGADYGRTKTEYKAQHLRSLGTEPIFAMQLSNRPKPPSPLPIRRVVDLDAADRVNAAARSRQIKPEDLHDGDARLRLYAAFDDHRPVAWVKSIPTGEGCAWVSNLFVEPEYRRRGLGRAIMEEMLAEDIRFGVRWSVLGASNIGAHLYDSMGYEQVGLLQIFAPIKERWGIPSNR